MKSRMCSISLYKVGIQIFHPNLTAESRIIIPFSNIPLFEEETFMLLIHNKYLRGY